MEIVEGMDGFMRMQMGSDLSTADGVTPAVETSGASGDVKLVVPQSGTSCFYTVVRN